MANQGPSGSHSSVGTGDLTGSSFPPVEHAQAPIRSIESGAVGLERVGSGPKVREKPLDELAPKFSFPSVLVAANAQFFEKTVEGAYRNKVGGLVSGVAPVLQSMSGSIAVSADVKNALAEYSQWKDRPFDAVGVPIAEKTYQAYYGSYSNGLLWPALHGLGDRCVQPEPQDWEFYRNVNAQFGAKILEVHTPGQLVWIHDYHLMLAPGMLRSAKPEVPIAYFHHIPFPEADQFESLIEPAQRKNILEGLLGSDLIGFHVQRYVHNFLDTLERSGLNVEIDRERNLVRYEGRTISVGAFPISVDAKGIEQSMSTEAVQQASDWFKSRYGDRTVIFGVERLDYTKGIEERCKAVELLLDQQPELGGNFRLVQYVAPSRENVPEYQLLRQRVHDVVTRVNEKHGTPDWKPIEYVEEQLDFNRVLGFCGASDVIVVTPLVDGMNLVIKEAIIASQPKTAFILGKGAGAAEELKSAIIVDGKSPQSISEGMATALIDLATAPESVELVNDLLKGHIRDNPIQKWSHSILTASAEAVSMRNLGLIQAGQVTTNRVEESPELIPVDAPEKPWIDVVLDPVSRYAAPEELLIEVKYGTPTLIALDYDGTLTDIVERPELAKISDSGRERLFTLSQHSDVALSVISGRSVDTLRGFLKGPEGGVEGQSIILCGLHGGEIWDASKNEWLRRPDPALRTDVGIFRQRLEDRLRAEGLSDSGLLVEDKGYSVALHYRQAPELESEASRIMWELYDQGDFEYKFAMRDGKNVIEMLPQEFSKGSALELLANRMKKETAQPIQIVAAGDDLTDESMFDAAERQAPGAVTIRLGDLTSQSVARHRLAGPAELAQVLDKYLSESPH